MNFTIRLGLKKSLDVNGTIIWIKLKGFTIPTSSKIPVFIKNIKWKNLSIMKHLAKNITLSNKQIKITQINE